MLVGLQEARIEFKRKPQTQYRTVKTIKGLLDFSQEGIKNSRFRGKILCAGASFRSIL